MFQEVGGLHGDSERGGLIFSSDVTVNTEALKLVSKKNETSHIEALYRSLIRLAKST